MNERHENHEGPAMHAQTLRAVAIDDVALDRLVDGELNETDRRALLAALDHSATGWKRCALAFLEAQAWRQAMGGAGATVVKPISARVAAAGKGHDPMTRARPARLLFSRMMKAAVIALIFTLGAIVGSNFRHAAPDAGSSPGVNAHQPHAPVPPEGATLLNVRAAADAVQRVSVPLLPADSATGTRLTATAPAVPDYVQAQLQRQGYEMTRDRKLVSIALDDGRKVTIPVDTIRWQYVGHETH